MSRDLHSALLVAALFAVVAPGSNGERLQQSSAHAAESLSMLQGFQAPPAEARPRVWWHWMNGNISKAGIQADIEWMSRIGIGGLQNFDAALNTPQLVEERLVYMTPEWKDAFRFAAEEADKRGLELAIAGSPGWSETGGPWVAADDGMKKVVWSSTLVQGGAPAATVLPPLPRASGGYLDISGHGTEGLSSAVHDVPELARDTLVLAFPAPPRVVLPAPSMSSAGVALDAEALTDGRYATSVEVARGKNKQPTVIAMTYAAPQTVRALTLHIPNAAGMLGEPNLAPVLEASDDGAAWRAVADVGLTEAPSTVSFAPVTARHFRVVLHSRKAASPLQSMEFLSLGVDAAAMITVFDAAASATEEGADNSTLARLSGAAANHQISELSLHARPIVSQFEQKAGFYVAPDYYALPATDIPASDSVPADAVINLTDKLSQDGSLDWSPPAGTWQVLRLGYSLTGKTNHPAPPEATGLEVDKFDGDAVRRYIQTYLGNYRDATGERLMGERGLRALLTDSIEVGPSNWTPKIIEQFKRLRGYDPTSWLPTLTGVVVGSGAQSDAFLYDYRRTLADLIASEHYGVIAQVTDELGMTYYSEAVESIRTTLGDDMAMRALADVPMAAMWTYGKSGPDQPYILDIRGAASVSHIYGQNLVAAESLTSVMQPWAHSPAQLRPMMDLMFAHGVNRPVIHTSVHQPVDDKVPGLALLIFGQYFNRHETWAEMAKPWVDYMARSSFLLQQGRHYADVAYFYGEEAPLTMLFREGLPADAPKRYAFDFINSDALRDVTSVENAELVTEGGARYRVLYLGGNSRYMTLPTLRRIAELVAQGATVVGTAPESTPSLADDSAAFASLVDELWHGSADGAYGKGRVIAAADVESVLAALGLAPDFAHGSDAEVLFNHRRLADGDLYFLSNRTDEDISGEYRFRVSGRTPKVWRADTGAVHPVSYRMEEGVTVIDLEMAAHDAFFVVFGQRTADMAATVPPMRWQTVADIGTGAWTVALQPGRGARPNLSLPVLAPLNEHADADVRYFSGVAKYTTSFELPLAVQPGGLLHLDLGEVGDVAEVYVNGKFAGTAWREPFRVAVGEHVQPGANTLEVRVANLWVNRLIGDAQPDAAKVTWTSTPVYLQKAPLRASGLLGPVTLLAGGH
ncbi:MAG: glycoside hydrolase [Halioglobus sp.]|nr:glycoside hydrolase [Halioglobus sp.]